MRDYNKKSQNKDTEFSNKIINNDLAFTAINLFDPMENFRDK